MNINLRAFLVMIGHSEGTDRAPAPLDPYRTCFGFKHIIQDFRWHPAEIRPDGTNEWVGESLAFLGPMYEGKISTAAGRYQITRPTWMRLKKLLLLPDFGPDAQDDCAVQLIKEAGALNLVVNGQVADAINLCHNIWASLPGSSSGQPQSSFASLMTAYGGAGGGFA